MKSSMTKMSHSGMIINHASFPETISPIPIATGTGQATPTFGGVQVMAFEKTIIII